MAYARKKPGKPWSKPFALMEHDGRFHLIYEKGTEKPYNLGITSAEFDLEWLLS